jgi:hypothetical protein
MTSMAQGVFGIVSRASIEIYTLLVGGRFGSLGRGSRIHPPLRVSCPWAIHVGEGVTVGPYSWFNVQSPNRDAGPALVIGDGPYIGRLAHINAFQKVVLEADVLIADGVFISDNEHRHDDRRIPIVKQGCAFKGPVLLRSGCWIGEGARILPGVTIGKNAVIGANSVVTHSVPDYAIACGVPARVINPAGSPLSNSHNPGPT